MKRHDAGSFKGDLLKMIDAFAVSKNLSINDESTQRALLEEIDKEVHESRINPIRLHGFRVESMFAYTAAALGACKLITEEDKGIFFDKAGVMRRPDFRIVTEDDQRFFVEVKNYHESDLDKTFNFKIKYFEGVRSYAEAQGLPLKFAIYWSVWNIWTLVDSKRIECSAGKYRIDFLDAVKNNEMHLIGDQMVATLPPLEVHFRFLRNKDKPISSEGKVEATVNNISIFSAGKLIEDPIEVKLAWYFCRYCKWSDQKSEMEMEGDDVIIQKLSFAPTHPIPGQDFDILGSLSQMISQQYKEQTAQGDTITSISPSAGVEQFGVVIPEGYKGKMLHLWLMSIRPVFSP